MEHSSIPTRQADLSPIQGSGWLRSTDAAACLLVPESGDPQDCLQDIARSLLKWEQADALETVAARRLGALAAVTVSVAGGPASTRTALEVPHSCSVRFLKRAIERASGVSLAGMHMGLSGMHMFGAGSGHKWDLCTTVFLGAWPKQKVIQQDCMPSTPKVQLPLKPAMHEHLLPTQTQALPGA